MDPSEMPDPTLIPESSQMLTEENSQGNAESPHNFSETLIRNLSQLSLNNARTNFPSPLPEDLPQPLTQRQARRKRISQDIRDAGPYRRRGVRTLLSERRDRLARLRYLLLNNGYSRSESRSEPFKCRCSFCVHHRWDPSENARIGNYDTEPISP
ncbi:developmental pluripotency-associated protein 3 [Eulemur rufifrons]|uniref:developmental pluripotency-associated protein 3 n=1 Tax=Eulemur rufifrons TaxID=859984 RepID=UPI003743B304